MPRFMPVRSGATRTSSFGMRWGTMHRGTDYGRDGGSGNDPVYAAQGGTVVHAGPASGFGGPDPAGWVVIDHPTADGSGTTVYGHIIREVQVGQRVEAGQRIGRINPSQGSNGGVAPHLHFEVHPTVWSPGSQIDPVPWLAGAHWPDQPPPSAPPPAAPGTIFGIDVSEHQDGLSLQRAAAEGYEFAILRLCDGTYADRTFRSHLADAEQTAMVVATYWYLRAPSEGTTIAQQVDVIDRQMGGRRDLGVWIDVESVVAGKFTLTAGDVWAAKQELESRGYHVPGVYTGRWYWEHMPGGEPSMEGLGHLWVSDYGDRDRSGAGVAIYAASGGDGHRGWSYPLGDRRPDVLQFGSRALVAGHQPVDVNAFKGTRDQLAAVFSGKDVSFMAALSDDEQRRLLDNTDYLVGQFGPHERLGFDDQGRPLTFIDWAKTLAVKLDYVFGQLRPWAQLGKNDKGQDLTLVDANAAQRVDDAAARSVIDKISESVENLAAALLGKGQ